MVRCQTFSFSFFPCSADHERDWPPCKVVFFKALHGRLAGRFKPPLAGRCNDFAPSRQKKCHRQKQPSRPGLRKKNNTAPSRPVEKKKKPPRPASEKKNNRPVPPRKKNKTPRPASKKKKTPRPAMNSKIHRPEGGNWKQIPPPVTWASTLPAARPKGTSPLSLLSSATYKVTLEGARLR